MDNEKITELLFNINGKLSGIETKLDSLSESILKHEARLTNLENSFNKHIHEVSSKHSAERQNWKDEIITLLVKTLIIGATSIAGLTGVAGIVSKIFGA